MPPVKAGGGPSPLSNTTSNSKGNGGSLGGAHRGTHDSPTNLSHATNGSVISGEASLVSQDFVWQLLRIASGDLSAVAALGTATDTNAPSLDMSGHSTTTTATGRAGVNTNTTITVASGDITGDLDGAKRDSQVKSCGAKDGRLQSSSSSISQPVPVLRPSEDSGALQGQHQQFSNPKALTSATTLTGVSERNVKTSNTACVTTNAEACTFYLTALVAHALRMEDYWVDLGHQIEVDQHVEFIQFCADAGFGTLKTMHLLQWWRQYRALVRDAAATHTLQLSDGNPQKPSSISAALDGTNGVFTASAATAAYSNGDINNVINNSLGVSGSGVKDGTAGGVKGSATKKSRRNSATAGVGAAQDADVPTTTTVAAAPGAPPSSSTSSASASAAAYASHDVVVRTELQRFIQWELEHEHEWRLVPREPLNGTGSGLISPINGVGSGSVAASVAAAQATTGKSSKADKAKMQMQQQQEMELEEQRLARIAALPPENIFLTKHDVDVFVRVVIQEGLLSHARLHAYVATQSCQPAHTLTHAAAAPVVFSVQVEVPMPVLPLREATRLVAPAAVSPSVTPRMSSDVADGNTNNLTSNISMNGTQTAPTRALSQSASSVSTKPRSRGNSKNVSTAAAAASNTTTTTNASAVAEGENTDEAAAVASATPPSNPVVPTAMEALRAAQLKEAAAYRAAYAAELAHAAAEAQQSQYTADVNLFFAKSNTNTAVQTVYASMEDAVSERQQRILQRIAALETALRLAEGEGAAAENTGVAEGA